jgi:hypothetical protein
MNTNILRPTAVSSQTGSTGVDSFNLLAFIAAGAKRVAASLASLFQTRAETTEESAQRLEALADEYEATQPSFAADLRAVIARSQSREGV